MGFLSKFTEGFIVVAHVQDALYVAGNDGQSRAISCLHLMANLVPLIEIIFYTSQHTGWKIEAITDKYFKAEMFLVCSVICFATFAFQRNCLSSFLLLSCHLSSLFFLNAVNVLGHD